MAAASSPITKLEPPQIYEIRDEAVVLDSDLARLFGLSTSKFNQRVKAHLERFEGGYAFQLTEDEAEILIYQSGTSSGHGGRRTPPWVFTEHGAAMAATIIRTPEAVDATRFIIKTFVAARKSGIGPKAASQALVAKQDALPAPDGTKEGLLVKLDAALGRVLDAIADPASDTTVRDEARAIALEGLNAVKAHLRKQGVQNEKTLAEIQKLLKEAEAIDAEVTAKHIENDHRRLAYLAKQLRIVIEVQRYMENGSVDGLLAVLKDLGG
ncbi:ORF6N domain-containing protein [Roseibium hamelinense]|uniref:ORF6N domain-containing protein n=1 Tax=Roseibium hamelinense TaxID=150831 RepID=A0A562TG55_9HYPH|nr:ORF6N domain-containing protein [Roseibium hamelinense]MTI43106.1 ORF6N domain-containing protein [Roseibium hamelinense]TWI92547.1 ORF6N domain-containing protein [Roseibium hamelinense]